MSELPCPMVAADVDLKDFAYTPIYRARLFGSQFHSRATDAEWRAGVTLWLKSQDQSPAGSLPTDDVDLCRLAELGRDLKTWRKLREGALRGWVKCTDGRLYNKVVAEVVNEQWQSKIDQRNKTLKARITALEKRLSQTDDSTDRDGIERLLLPLRQALAEYQKLSVTESVTDLETGSKRREGKGREGKGLDNRPPTPPKGGERFADFWKAYPHRGAHPDPKPLARKAFLQAIADGAEPDLIIGSAIGYAAAVKADGVEPRWVHTAAKWLRAGCWESVIDAQLADDAPAESAEHFRWRLRVEDFRRGGRWLDIWGAAPGQPGYTGPRDLLMEKVA